MTAVKGVIFDWAGTLTPWHPVDLAAIWRTTARTLDGAGADDGAGLAEQLLAAERELLARCRDTHCSATLDDVFKAAEVVPGPVTLRAYRAAWEEHTFLDAHGAQVLRELRERGLRVGVLSNTLWPAAWHDEIFTRDGVSDLIDAALYSSEVPWTKPHPEIFAAAVERLGVDSPRACVFVGDRLFEDVQGAATAGMRTVWLPHSRLSAEELVATTAEPDARIVSLKELPALVDGWNGR